MSDRQGVAGQGVGSMISGSFGLAYVVANSGSLPGPVAWVLRAVAAATFVAVLVLVLRQGRPAPRPTGGGRAFGPAYWAVVALEVAAFVVGSWVLREVLDRPGAGVAWVSFVVGVHFFGLARVFGQSFFVALGAVVTACGVAGLALAFAGSAQVLVDVVAGVVPGFVLLASGVWGARRRAAGPAYAGSERVPVG